MDAKKLEAVLKLRLGASEVSVEDESAAHKGHGGNVSGGGHYRVRIVSDRFTSRSQIDRHRMVYDALKSEFGSDIHALALQTLAPDEDG